MFNNKREIVERGTVGKVQIRIGLSILSYASLSGTYLWAKFHVRVASLLVSRGATDWS